MCELYFSKVIIFEFLNILNINLIFMILIFNIMKYIKVKLKKCVKVFFKLEILKVEKK